MKTTNHASIRCQQRGVPPLAIEMLQAHGVRDFDHHGGVVRYMDKRTRRLVERELGAQVMRQLGDFMDLYVVESVKDGVVITVGHRYKRIHRY